jgi:ligand-binding sensor domain-containing protein
VPQGKVLSLLQSRDGYLWIGTAAGIVRYDGRHFELFDRHSTPALQTDTCVNMQEAADGTLYFFNHDGMVSYRRRVPLPPFPAGPQPQTGVAVAADELPAAARRQRIEATLLDREGNLWVGTDGAGLFLLRPRQAYNYTTSDGLAGNDVWQTVTAADKTLWIGTMQGLSRLSERGISAYSNTAGEGVSTLWPDASGGLWVAAGEDISLFRAGQWFGAGRSCPHDMWTWSSPQFGS